MSHAAVQATLIEAVKNSLPNDLPVALRNELFQPTPGETWIRVVYMPAGATKESLGSRNRARVQVAGDLRCELYKPVNAGDTPVLVIADQIILALENRTLTSPDSPDIRVLEGSLLPVGVSESLPNFVSFVLTFEVNWDRRNP